VTRSAPPATWRNRIVGSGVEPPDQLVANAANWRLHPETQQQALASVLDRVGWVGQVLVNRNSGRIVDGHLRVALAIERREPSVPVVYVELDAEEERLVLVSLDPIGAMAETDGDQLRALLEDIDFDSLALEAQVRSFLGHERPATLADPDEVPEPPAEPTMQAGELWRLGRHRLLVGDCTRPEDVARLLEGDQPRLLVTDPPYGVSLDPTWRDGVYNGLGPAERPYMRIEASVAGGEPTEAPAGRRGRSRGHRNTTLSGDTVADWSAAYALVPRWRWPTCGTPGSTDPRWAMA
jgi:hypothetical protein